jgi:carbamoyl-phosphate synthase large subunit
MTRTILILNSGDGTGLNFTRSLHDAGGWRTIGIDSTLDDLHCSETQTRHLVQWDQPQELIEIVNRICVEESVDLVYAADTGPELLAISAHRDQLTARTLLPPLADHLRMEDKWATWEALDAASCPVPSTVLVESGADLERVFTQYERVWLRRRRGSAGAGSMATASSEFAKAWVQEQRGWGEFTAAECLTGRTATFSGLWFDGELVCSQLRERMWWRYGGLSTSGVTGITGAQRTISDSALHQTAVDCIAAVCERPHGVIGADFTYDSDGRPLATEVQPARFYSSIHFLARLGLNLAKAYCTLACDGRDALGPARINPCPPNLYWVKGVEKLPQLLTSDEWAIYDPTART